MMKLRLRWTETCSYEAEVDVPDDHPYARIVDDAIQDENQDIATEFEYASFDCEGGYEEWIRLVEKHHPDWIKTALEGCEDRELDDVEVLLPPVIAED